MAKAQIKTQKSEASVAEFLESIADQTQRADSIVIAKMMQKVLGLKPKMWGTSIIGFGDVLFQYESGRELDWFKVGFSPRKGKLALYGLRQVADKYKLLEKLGKCKTATGCIYVRKLEDIDTAILKKMIEHAGKDRLKSHSEIVREQQKKK